MSLEQVKKGAGWNTVTAPWLNELALVKIAVEGPAGADSVPSGSQFERLFAIRLEAWLRCNIMTDSDQWTSRSYFNTSFNRSYVGTMYCALGSLLYRRITNWP